MRLITTDYLEGGERGAHVQQKGLILQAAGEGMTTLRPDQVNDWITGKATVPLAVISSRTKAGLLRPTPRPLDAWLLAGALARQS